MKYVEIAVEVGAEHADRLADELVGEGLAVEQRDASTLLKPPPGRALLIAWAEVGEAEETRAAVEEVLRREGISSEVRLATRDEDEWRDVWKQFFKPRSVGPFAIVPSWHAATYEPRPGETVLRIDPGRAFGTGGHASTRLCLEAIGRRPASEPVARVLDVGCGSGILGIACALRWPGCEVTSVDVDPEAVATTQENAADNHVESHVRASTTPLGRVPGRFDVVFANIQADVLAHLSSELLRAAAGGRLVLSGILVEQAQSVADVFTGKGARLVERIDDEGWSALVVSPPEERAA